MLSSFTERIIDPFKILTISSVRNGKSDSVKNGLLVLDARPTFSFTVVKQCSKKIDLGFVLDASGSIGRKVYEKVKTFTTDLLAQFDLSQSMTNAGVIVYSTAPKLVIKMNEFYDLKEFSKALSDRTPWPARGVKLSPPWMNEFTRIDQALILARDELFTVANGDRHDVRNALIFLTDGKQQPQAQRSLDYYAQPLKDDDVSIIAVGFGNANESELAKIASGPEFVLSYEGGVEVLGKAVGEIVDKLCNCEYFAQTQTL